MILKSRNNRKLEFRLVALGPGNPDIRQLDILSVELPSALHPGGAGKTVLGIPAPLHRGGAWKFIRGTGSLENCVSLMAAFVILGFSPNYADIWDDGESGAIYISFQSFQGK